MPKRTRLSSSSEAFLAGAGEMAERIRDHDWGATPLGPVSTWPQSLRSAVSILLPSRAQICLFWGRDLITLYNDAYRPTLGVKHPWALGRPAGEVWSEIWSGVLQPLLEGVLDTGDAFWASDHPFFLERHGYPEETFYDVSYDPVRDETGQVGGVFCIVSETTGRVVGERRLRTLRDLGAVASEAATMDEAFRQAARVLASNPHDVPFALLFDASQGANRLCSAAPGTVVQRSPDLWPLCEALRGEMLLTGDALVELGAPGALPGGPWPEPPREVLLLPMSIAGHDPVGVLVAGISPRRALDEDYRGFLRLAASRIAEAAGAVRALEQQRARAEALAEIDRAKSVFGESRAYMRLQHSACRHSHTRDRLETPSLWPVDGPLCTNGPGFCPASATPRSLSEVCGLVFALQESTLTDRTRILRSPPASASRRSGRHT